MYILYHPLWGLKQLLFTFIFAEIIATIKQKLNEYPVSILHLTAPQKANGSCLMWKCM